MPAFSQASAALVSARLLLILLTHPLEFCSLSSNFVGLELGKYMADVLRVNQTLKSVEYARPPPTFPSRQLSALAFCSFFDRLHWVASAASATTVSTRRPPGTSAKA